LPSCSLFERSGDKDLPWLRIPLHKSSRTGTHPTKTETHRRSQSVDPNRQDESGLIRTSLRYGLVSSVRAGMVLSFGVMFDCARLLLFLTAAVLFYLLAGSLAGGKRGGVLSALDTVLGDR
jgi:hypothetical protein